MNRNKKIIIILAILGLLIAAIISTIFETYQGIIFGIFLFIPFTIIFILISISEKENKLNQILKTKKFVMGKIISASKESLPEFENEYYFEIKAECQFNNEFNVYVEIYILTSEQMDLIETSLKEKNIDNIKVYIDNEDNEIFKFDTKDLLERASINDSEILEKMKESASSFVAINNNNI